MIAAKTASRPAHKPAATAESQDALLAQMLGGGETSFTSSLAAATPLPQRCPAVAAAMARHTPAARSTPSSLTPVSVDRCIMPTVAALHLPRVFKRSREAAMVGSRAPSQ